VKKLSKQKKLITAALASLASCTAFLSAPLTANSFILIDPFNAGTDINVYAPGTTTNYNESSPANGGGVLGDQREVQIIAPTTVATAAGIPGPPDPLDQFVIQQFATTGSRTGIVKFRWDGAATTLPSGNPDVAGLLGFRNFTLNGDDRLSVSVVDRNDIKVGSILTYTAWNGANSASSSVPIPLGNSSSPELFTFLFSSFAGIDFTQITGIELTVQLTSSSLQPASILIDQVQVGVPFEFSPALGLVSLGALFGLSHLRNRRKSSVSPNLEASKSEADSLVS